MNNLYSVRKIFILSVHKISSNVPGQSDLIVSKKPLKIGTNASKKRYLLEITFAVCSRRNKKSNETK